MIYNHMHFTGSCDIGEQVIYLQDIRIECEGLDDNTNTDILYSYVESLPCEARLSQL